MMLADDEILAAADGVERGRTPDAGADFLAVRQPGVVGYLQRRLGDDSDALGVALLGALAIHNAFTLNLGLAPARVESSLLRRAERAALDESGVKARPEDGLAARQPAVARFIAGVVAAPWVPLSGPEAARVGISLAAVTYALDEAATGRAVP
jgi:hypothetical protein